MEVKYLLFHFLVCKDFKQRSSYIEKWQIWKNKVVLNPRWYNQILWKLLAFALCVANDSQQLPC